MTKDEFLAYLGQIVRIDPVAGHPEYASVALATGHTVFIGRGVFVVLEPDTDGGPHGIEKLRALLRATKRDGEPDIL